VRDAPDADQASSRVDRRYVALKQAGKSLLKVERAAAGMQAILPRRRSRPLADLRRERARREAPAPVVCAPSARRLAAKIDAIRRTLKAARRRP
jgi:hypothetical protein